MLGVWLVQNWNGSQITSLAVQLWVLSYCHDFPLTASMRQAGMSTQGAFNISMITEALGVTGVGV